MISTIVEIFHQIIAETTQKFRKINRLQQELMQRQQAEEELRKNYENLIEELTIANAKLKQEVQERLQAEAEMRRFNEKLKLLIEERTAQLAVSKYELQQEICDRQLLEEKVRSCESKMRAVFGAMTDLVLLIDAKGNIEVLPTDTISLYPPNFDLINHTIGDFFESKDSASWWKKIQLALDTGQTINFDYSLPIDEQLLWFSARISPMSEDSVIWVARDITERKRIENKFQESQHWLQAINEANPHILYVYDLIQKQNIYTNWEVYKILGYTPEEVGKMGTGLMEKMMHPDNFPGIWQHHERLETAKDGDCFEFEYRMQHKNGESRWLLSRETVFGRTADGKARQILGAAIDISHRKKAERALLESELRFEKLADNMPGVLYIFVQRPDGYTYFEYISSATREIQELEPELVLKNASLCFGQIHPDDRMNYYQDLAMSALTLTPFSSEWRLVTPSGKIKSVQAKSRPELRDNGDIVWYGAIFDISDRKLAEEELKKSEANLAAAQRIAHIGSWKFDVLTEKISWSEELFHIFGLAPTKSEPTLAEHIQQIHSEDRDYWHKIVGRALKLGEPYEFEFRILRPDGQIRYVEARGEGVINSAKQVIQLFGTIMDITYRKHAEEALRESAKREQAIAKAIERMRQTLNLEVIFRATTEELRQFLNCDRVAIYRFKPDGNGEFVAESVASGWISLVDPHQHDSNLVENASSDSSSVGKKLISANNFLPETYLQKILNTPYSIGASYLCIEDIYQAGLTCHQIHFLEQFQAKAFALVPIVQGNKLWGLLATYQNSGFRQWEEAEINIVLHISAQLEVALQQAELLVQSQRQSIELMKAKEAADAANRAKSQFLAKMSHELRTPLNAILGFSQLMVRSNSLSKEQQEYLEIINNSGEHLLNLINDILSMAKIEAGQTTLNENCFSLFKLLNSIEEMLRLKASTKGLRLKFECSPEVPQYIQTDESKLRQILINILGNAIKFTQKGSVKLLVRRGNRDNSQSQPTHQSFITFKIEDTGPGIAPEEFSNLFQPFLQTQTGRQSMQGTGLGLPISQQFIKLMGGDISVSSKLDKGTTFTFDISVKLGCEADEKTIYVTRQIAGLEPHQPTYRILIVEDVKANRQLLVEQLKPLGFDLQEAENGQQAVTLWKSWQPHLIWMDMQMPVMDGYEATKLIKSHPKGQETVIIAITASAFEEQQSAILQAGCDDFVPKPFREEMIWEKMANHLGVRYIYEENSASTLSHSEPQPKSLTAKDLSVMPKEWLCQLHKAALSINDIQIIELIEEIPATQAYLVKALTDLVDNFRMDIIIELTQMYTDE